MVSSTSWDLSAYRGAVMDACLRQGMLPVMMEHLPATDSDAITESLRMVDEADIYLGIFANRYGYVPKGETKSITEMECERAKRRGIPRLIFVRQGDVPSDAANQETEECAARLKSLKERLLAERVVNFFRTPEELRGLVINSLSHYRRKDATDFHHVSEIPAPPEPYIAHPYTLLQTAGLVGRRTELELLTSWLSDPKAEEFGARILSVVAIGGMGKSALTWHWFNQVAPEAMSPLAGRIWWSFYESDATFENFIIRALSYVAEKTPQEVVKISPADRETRLLEVLRREPFLLALDGLERILIAYARMDAARLRDDELDEQTANQVAGARGLPESAAQSFTGQHRLRKTADPRAGAFLRRLASGDIQSRVLISTRLYPAELQTETFESVPGSKAYFLSGLNAMDALNLWKSHGVSGAGDELLPLFDSFEKHPLLIQVLAGEVAKYRPAPGDFDRWRKAHPKFDPTGLPAVQVKSHVLEFAMRGLDGGARHVLNLLAAFRMPASYDTLTAILVGEEKRFKDEQSLDGVLVELEDRGLLGWDRKANRYDLHPLVRGVSWRENSYGTRQGIYGALRAHFESIPREEEFWTNVNHLEELTGSIELFSALVGEHRYDDAYKLYDDRLHWALVERLKVNRVSAELLEQLFPEGLDQQPGLTDTADQSDVVTCLASAYLRSGRPRRAATLYGRGNHVPICAAALQMSGSLWAAERAARRALIDVRTPGSWWHQSLLRYRPSAENLQRDIHIADALNVSFLGSILAARGENDSARVAFGRVMAIRKAYPDSRLYYDTEAEMCAHLAQWEYWNGRYDDSLSLAGKVWTSREWLNDQTGAETRTGDYARAACLMGKAALELGDFGEADHQLQYALSEARSANLIEDEITARISLADLRRRQKDFDEARNLLDDVWELAERGPYTLYHADALNLLAEIERAIVSHEAACAAATKAYQLAWCDGPPFSYHWGVEKARALLKALGVDKPSMPPFKESKFEPMPKVEIDPLDEFRQGGLL